MNRWIVVLWSVLSSVHVLAADAITAKSGEPVDFMVLDSDHNGYVSRVEARSVSAVEDQFDLADANRDGLLEKDEYAELGNTRAPR